MKLTAVISWLVLVVGIAIAVVSLWTAEQPPKSVDNLSASPEPMESAAPSQVREEIKSSSGAQLAADGSTNSRAQGTYAADDQETTRREVRDLAAQYVKDVYSLLIRDLDLSPGQLDALNALLIEAEIAATRTVYSSGEGLDALERADRIAAIIGDEKLQILLARERDRYHYQELAKIHSILNLDDAELDGFLQILVDVGGQVRSRPRDPNLEPIEQVELMARQEDEFDRLVLELAPSVISLEQVQRLFDLYQAQSNQRARAIEAQRRLIAQDPSKSQYVGLPSRNR